jgi:hypothetical protein
MGSTIANPAEIAQPASNIGQGLSGEHDANPDTDEGLDIFASGYPKSSSITHRAATMETGIEQTVSAGNSSLQYDASTDV